MSDITTNCIVCGAPEDDRPIVIFRYQGDQAGICTDCLPTMIHRREQIMEKLQKDKPSS